MTDWQYDLFKWANENPQGGNTLGILQSLPQSKASARLEARYAVHSTNQIQVVTLREVGIDSRLANTPVHHWLDTELLAVVAGIGIEQAEKLNRAVLDLKHLSQMIERELAGIPGMTQVRARRVLAGIELGRRAVHAPQEIDRPIIKSPADVHNLLSPMMANLFNEQMRVLYLDTKNRVMLNDLVYQGSVNTTTIRIAELFRRASALQTTGIIIVHNHPSGDPTPSPEDVAVTREIAHAGKILDVDLMDHIVIGDAMRFVSLKERGLGFG